MDNSNETINTWNHIAALYEQKFMDMPIYHPSYDIFCDALTKINSCILEVGCGPGNITQYLLRIRPELEIFGTDIAANMVDIAAKNNPEAQFQVMDARSIGNLKKQYDGIVAGFCIPYLNEEETFQFLKDSFLLLREDGVLYFSFVPGAKEKSGFKTGSGGRVYFFYHELPQITSMLSQIGFHTKQRIEVLYPTNNEETEKHVIIIAGK